MAYVTGLASVVALNGDDSIKVLKCFCRQQEYSLEASLCFMIAHFCSPVCVYWCAHVMRINFCVVSSFSFNKYSVSKNT